MASKARKKTDATMSAAITELKGYRRAPRYAWREFSPPDLPEGEEPLRMKVRTNLSFGEIDDIAVGANVTFEESFKTIAPYIVEWNVIRENLETGELEAVPPPATAGWEVLQVLDYLEGYWAVFTIKNAHLGDSTRKKDSTPSVSTPERSEGENTESQE